MKMRFDVRAGNPNAALSIMHCTTAYLLSDVLCDRVDKYLLNQMQEGKVLLTRISMCFPLTTTTFSFKPTNYNCNVNAKRTLRHSLRKKLI